MHNTFHPHIDDFGLSINNDKRQRKNTLSDQQLSSLQTFICAAQHLSFLIAAEYLCISPSAVSHRMKKLEKQLGVSVFHRFPRQLKLTDEGERLYFVLKDLFEKVQLEIQEIQSHELSGSLNVFSHPSVSSDWLIPRLHHFTHLYPSIQINIRSGNIQADFQTQSIDVAIYYSNGHFPSLNNQKFMEEESLPVCSPHYAKKHNLIGKPENLHRCTLLHDAKAWHYSAPDAEWQMWGNQAQIDISRIKSAHSFDSSRCATYAALNHMGVAMGRLRLTQEWLQSGQLISPFKLPALKNNYCYYAVWPKQQKIPQKLTVFLSWLSQQGIESEALIKPLAS